VPVQAVANEHRVIAAAVFANRVRVGLRHVTARARRRDGREEAGIVLKRLWRSPSSGRPLSRRLLSLLILKAGLSGRQRSRSL
jgi:hypothetical protein